MVKGQAGGADAVKVKVFMMRCACMGCVRGI